MYEAIESLTEAFAFTLFMLVLSTFVSALFVAFFGWSISDGLEAMAIFVGLSFLADCMTG
jgi:hypothetical protein